MKNYFYFLLLILAFISCTKSSDSSNSPQLNEWHDLLTDNLDTWTLIGDFQRSIENNELYLEAKIENQNGWLLTENEYDNFKLEAEFLASSLTSGIVFRYNDQLKTMPDIAGYEVNLDFNSDQQNPTGTIKHTARATVLEDINVSDWNKIGIEAQGDHLKVYLNDQLVAETHDRKSSKGKIGLKAPKALGKRAGFRKVRIMLLPEVAVTEPQLEDRYRNADGVTWEPLFDGETLTGWSPIGDGQWEISEGIVHGHSGETGGFLISDKAYKNFYLKLQFKIIKEDNSGIFIRKSPDSTSVTITDAIECNIYDHNGPAHPYSTGSIATHARAWYGMIDYTDWNTMEIFAHEDQVVMFVNGQKSSEIHLPPKFNKAGNICLQGGIKVFSQDQGPSDIYFKDMLIKDMDGQ